MRDFEYVAPRKLEDALLLASEHPSDGVLLAGGTDLVVQMKRRKKQPSFLINLKGIEGLDAIEYDVKDALRIGPLVTHEALARHKIVLEKFPALAEAAHSVGSLQVRERGTIGGNLCNASPAADTIPVLICLKAKLRIQSAKGERTVPVEEFFRGPQITSLSAGEILTEIRIPVPEPHTGASYLKMGVRKSLEIALVGVAAALRMDVKKEACLEARIGLGSVAPTPLLCADFRGILVGERFSEEAVEKTAKKAMEASRPISDVRCSAGYRKDMVYVLSKRALMLARERVQ